MKSTWDVTAPELSDEQIATMVGAIIDADKNDDLIEELQRGETFLRDTQRNEYVIAFIREVQYNIIKKYAGRKGITVVRNSRLFIDSV